MLHFHILQLLRNFTHVTLTLLLSSFGVALLNNIHETPRIHLS